MTKKAIILLIIQLFILQLQDVKNISVPNDKDFTSSSNVDILDESIIESLTMLEELYKRVNNKAAEDKNNNGPDFNSKSLYGSVNKDITKFANNFINNIDKKRLRKQLDYYQNNFDTLINNDNLSSNFYKQSNDHDNLTNNVGNIDSDFVKDPSLSNVRKKRSPISLLPYDSQLDFFDIQNKQALKILLPFHTKILDVFFNKMLNTKEKYILFEDLINTVKDLTPKPGVIVSRGEIKVRDLDQEWYKDFRDFLISNINNNPSEHSWNKRKQNIHNYFWTEFDFKDNELVTFWNILTFIFKYSNILESEKIKYEKLWELKPNHWFNSFIDNFFKNKDKYEAILSSLKIFGQNRNLNNILSSKSLIKIVFITDKTDVKELVEWSKNLINFNIDNVNPKIEFNILPNNASTNTIKGALVGSDSKIIISFDDLNLHKLGTNVDRHFIRYFKENSSYKEFFTSLINLLSKIISPEFSSLHYLISFINFNFDDKKFNYKNIQTNYLDIFSNDQLCWNILNHFNENFKKGENFPKTINSMFYWNKNAQLFQRSVYHDMFNFYFIFNFFIAPDSSQVFESFLISSLMKGFINGLDFKSQRFIIDYFSENKDFSKLFNIIAELKNEEKRLQSFENFFSKINTNKFEFFNDSKLEEYYNNYQHFKKSFQELDILENQLKNFNNEYSFIVYFFQSVKELTFFDLDFFQVIENDIPRFIQNTNLVLSISLQYYETLKLHNFILSDKDVFSHLKNKNNELIQELINYVFIYKNFFLRFYDNEIDKLKNFSFFRKELNLTNNKYYSEQEKTLSLEIMLSNSEIFQLITSRIDILNDFFNFLSNEILKFSPFSSDSDIEVLLNNIFKDDNIFEGLKNLKIIKFNDNISPKNSFFHITSEGIISAFYSKNLNEAIKYRNNLVKLFQNKEYLKLLNEANSDSTYSEFNGINFQKFCNDVIFLWFKVYRLIILNLSTIYRWTNLKLTDNEWKENIYLGFCKKSFSYGNAQELDEYFDRALTFLEKTNPVSIKNIGDFLNSFIASDVSVNNLLKWDLNRENYQTLKTYYKKSFELVLKDIKNLLDLIPNSCRYGSDNNPLWNWFNNDLINFPENKRYNFKFIKDTLDGFLNGNIDIYARENRILEVLFPNNNEQLIRDLSMKHKSFLSKAPFLYILFPSFSEKSKKLHNEVQGEGFKNLEVALKDESSPSVSKYIGFQHRYKITFLDSLLKLIKDFKASNKYLGYDFNDLRTKKIFQKIFTSNDRQPIKSIIYFEGLINDFKARIHDTNFDLDSEIKKLFKSVNIANENDLVSYLEKVQIEFHNKHMLFWEGVLNKLFTVNQGFDNNEYLNSQRDFKYSLYKIKAKQFNDNLNSNFFLSSYHTLNNQYFKVFKAKINSFSDYFKSVHQIYSIDYLKNDPKFLGFYDELFSWKLNKYLQSSDHFINTNFKKLLPKDVLSALINFFPMFDNKWYSNLFKNDLIDEIKFKNVSYLELFKNSNTSFNDLQKLLLSARVTIRPNDNFYTVIEKFTKNNLFYKKVMLNQIDTKQWYIDNLIKYYQIPVKKNTQNFNLFQGLGYYGASLNSEYHINKIIASINTKNHLDLLTDFDEGGKFFNNFYQYQFSELKKHTEKLKQNFIEKTKFYKGLGYDKTKLSNFQFNFDPSTIFEQLQKFLNNPKDLKKLTDQKLIDVNNFLELSYNKITNTNYYIDNPPSFDKFSQVLDNFILEQKKCFLYDLNDFYRKTYGIRFSIFRFENQKLNIPLLDFHFLKNFIQTWYGTPKELYINNNIVTPYQYLKWFRDNQKAFLDEQEEWLAKNLSYQHIFFKKTQEILGINSLKPSNHSKIEKISIFNHRTMTVYNDYLSNNSWDKFNVLSFKRIVIGNRVFFTLFDFYGYSIIIETDNSLTSDKFRNMLRSDNLQNVPIIAGAFYQHSLGDKRLGVFRIDNKNFQVSKTGVEFGGYRRKGSTVIRYRLQLENNLETITKDKNILNIFHQDIDKNKFSGLLKNPYPALLLLEKQHSDWKVNFISLPYRYFENLADNSKIFQKGEKVFDEASIYTIQILSDNNKIITLKNLKNLKEVNTMFYNTHFYRVFDGNKMIDIVVSNRASFLSSKLRSAIDESVISLDFLKLSGDDSKILPFNRLSQDEVHKLLPDLFIDVTPELLDFKFPTWAMFLVAGAAGLLIGVPSLWFIGRRMRLAHSYKKKINKIDNTLVNVKSNKINNKPKSKTNSTVTFEDLIKKRKKNSKKFNN